jgi:predicted nuclease with TOPRIM domain
LESVSGAAQVAIAVVEEDDVQPGGASLQSDTGDTSIIVQGSCHVFSENEDSFTSAGDSTPPTSHGDAEESLMVEEHCDDSPKDDIPGDSTSHLPASEETSSHDLAEQAFEKRQLQEALQYQQLQSSGLRSQLVDCEQELENTQAKLREAERQRGLYEAESDETSQQVLKLQQELALTKSQLAEDKSVTSVPPQSQHATNAAVVEDFDVAAIMAAYTHACEAAKAATADSEYVRGMLQEVIKERDSLNHQLHQKNDTVNEVRQWLQVQLSQANDLNGHLRDNIGGLEGQINQLLQAKEVSDEFNAGLQAQVAELTANNQTLLHDFTNKLIADPQDIIDPVKCTYNESRDLRNQVESAQATSAQFARVNQNLSKELQEEKEKSSSLQTDRDLLNNKCARLAANYEVLEDKVEHWMEILPKVLRRRPEVSEEEYATWKEQYFLQSRAHVARTKRHLKSAALDVSSLESKLATTERQHKAEVARLEGSVSEVTSKNVELEAENFNLGLKLHDAQGQVELLESQLASSNQAAQLWREQCEGQVWGDTAVIVRNAHRDEVESLKDQIYALQHMNTELRLGKEAAAGDVCLFKWNFAETITRMREFEAERMFARAKTDAMEERFAEALREEPLRIQKRDAFEELSHEQKQQLLRTEDAWIVIATGINLGRGYDPERASPAMGVWETFMAEVNAWQEKHDKEASEGA